MASIAKANGIKPLVAQLDSSDEKTTAYAARVLADMARKQEEYAKQVAQAGGIALCVKLLGLAAKAAPTPNDKAQLRNTAAHVARLAIQHGGAFVDLSQRLQKTLNESAALKR